jgi:hypothetical protein
MMRQISEGIYGLLVSQGIANGRAGTRANGGKVARTVGAGAAGIGADDQGEEPGRPLAGMRKGGERNPMGMGKGAPAETGASQQGGFRRHAQEPSPANGRPVLRLIVSNKDVRRRDPTSVAPLGLRTSLVLV